MKYIILFPILTGVFVLGLFTAAFLNKNEKPTPKPAKVIQLMPMGKDVFGLDSDGNFLLYWPKEKKWVLVSGSNK